jgi:hypothetical protein
MSFDRRICMSQVITTLITAKAERKSRCMDARVNVALGTRVLHNLELYHSLLYPNSDGEVN